MVGGKLDKLVSKESGGKLSASPIGLGGSKRFKELGVKRMMKATKGGDSGIGRGTRSVILKKVMGGKIKTPIPGKFFKPMMSEIAGLGKKPKAKTSLFKMPVLKTAKKQEKFNLKGFLPPRKKVQAFTKRIQEKVGKSSKTNKKRRKGLQKIKT